MHKHIMIFKVINKIILIQIYIKLLIKSEEENQMNNINHIYLYIHK